MALLFASASSQYLSWAANLAGAQPFSVAFWYKPTTNNVSYVPWCIGNTTGGTHTDAFVNINASGVPLITQSQFGGGSSTATSGSATVDGTWCHIAATFSSTTACTIYFNGVAVSSTGGTAATLTCQVTQVGALMYGGTVQNYTDGAVAYLAMWSSYGLTQTDVNNLYNGGSGANPSLTQNANLAAFLEMQAGSPYLDQIGSRTWTVHGSPTVVADPFSLSGGAPTVTAQAATSITAYTATLNGTITNENGGGNSTVEGFQYGLTTLYGSSINTSGSYTTGAYSQGVTGLAPGITYHFRAYSTNPGGPGFSGDSTFTTAAAGAANKGSVLYNGTQLANASNVVTFGSVANVFDGNCATALNTSNTAAWVGIDCGAPVTLTYIYYSALCGARDMCLGATLNGNLADPTFASPTLLYTFPSTTRPAQGSLMNSAPLSPGATYRYYNAQTTAALTWGFADLDFVGTWASGVYSQPVAPVITPSNGNYDQPTVVRMSSQTTSATIYYTTNNTTPNTSSTVYTGPFVVSTSCAIQAIAYDQQLSTPASRVITGYFYIPSSFYNMQLQWDDRPIPNSISTTQGYIFQGQDKWWYWHVINVNGNGGNAAGAVQSGTDTYKSADLRNWTYTGNICALGLGLEIVGQFRVVARGGVLYNSTTNLYVKWLTQDNYEAQGVEVWTSPAPDGSGTWTKFAVYTSASPLGDGNHIASTFYGDMGVFVDPVSGTAYLIYNWDSNTQTAFSVLNPANYTNTIASGSATYTDHREAHALVWNGTNYFWVNSDETGNTPNLNEYATGSTPIGPWSGLTNPFVNVAGAPSYLTCYAGQTNQILYLPGRNAYIFLYNNYVVALGNWEFNSFLPITFPTSSTMSISWQNSTLWFDGVTQYSPWSLDTVFPTISGAPAAATGLSVTSGLLASWTNNEPNPAFIYLDSSNSATFASGVISEVLPYSATSFQATAQTGTYWRVRTVNANGTTNSAAATVGPYVDPNALPPVTVGATGIYVVLAIDSVYREETLIGGVDYSGSVERIVSGPYANDGLAQQALWNLLDPGAPLAHALPIPPPGPWTTN